MDKHQPSFPPRPGGPWPFPAVPLLVPCGLLGAVLLMLVAVALILVAQVHDEHGTGDRLDLANQA